VDDGAKRLPEGRANLLLTRGVRSPSARRVPGCPSDTCWAQAGRGPAHGLGLVAVAGGGPGDEQRVGRRSSPPPFPRPAQSRLEGAQALPDGSGHDRPEQWTCIPESDFDAAHRHRPFVGRRGGRGNLATAAAARRRAAFCGRAGWHGACAPATRIPDASGRAPPSAGGTKAPRYRRSRRETEGPGGRRGALSAGWSAGGPPRGSGSAARGRLAARTVLHH
jgi:hypothetical protein